MKNLPQIPDIPEEQQTPVVKVLLALLEQFAERIAQQDEEIERLKDEVSILIGEKKRPTFKGSKLDSKADADTETSDAAGDRQAKRAGSNKRAKNAQLIIHQDTVVTPDELVPEGSRFKGYRDFVTQDISIQPHNTRYRLERWITPEGKTLTGQLPVAVSNRHSGP